MEERKGVSVAMAAYNGENYIKEQIESILPQLGETDEIIISLDPSNDRTREIIISFADDRIRLIDGPGEGVLKNFENAIAHSRGKYIFLCDQDDIWTDEKVSAVIDVFSKNNVSLVLHDAEVVDGSMNRIHRSFFELRGTRIGFWRNFIRNSYIGCCMAFRAELLKYILPLPAKIPMHDQWIGLQAERHGGTALLHKKLLKYRRHGENVSSDNHASIVKMFLWRWRLFCALIKK